MQIRNNFNLKHLLHICAQALEQVAIKVWQCLPSLGSIKQLEKSGKGANVFAWPGFSFHACRVAKQIHKQLQCYTFGSVQLMEQK
eukprot:2718134-Amphidinium_carterae.1